MKRLLALLLLLPSLCFGAALDQSKIIAPSSGVYLGAYEWTAGDIAAVEAATGSLRSCITMTDSITHPNCASASVTGVRGSKGMGLF